MIVKCDKCKSEFNLNESLLKKGGSTVRCSVCKNLFKVFPSEPELFESPIDDEFSDAAMEETVALDMPPDFEEIEEEPIMEGKRDSFDKAFEEAMEEVAEDDDLIVRDEESMYDEEDTSELMTEKADRTAVKIKGIQRKEKGRPRLLLISLSIALFLIVAFLVIFFFFPSVLPFSSTQPASNVTEIDGGISKLDFEDVDGGFVETGSAGKLFVIHGSVINNYTKTRSHILLKGGLLGKDSKPLKEEMAYAGNTMTDEKLKAISKEEIKNAMKNKSGTNNNNVDIKPGSAVPFMIIITDLPDMDKMLDYTVEAISSSPNK